ncbi:transglutaminase family protein [Neobacillus cucumis]|uniref:Transglutaminase family protein n=1 Tax=Neobacillus cucumis TaxID=1740721 RepID=A0A2N5HN96_9BACI|nr:transglutaminase family protein [Neobacillus cucumis]PLS06957.1 transglutaminase family protein [Neobacillus cucumis]
MKLKISHYTLYTYQEAIDYSVNEIRLTPQTDSRQFCYEHSISVQPNVELFSYEDFFVNKVHAFSVTQPHQELLIKAHSIVFTDEKELYHRRPLPLFTEKKIIRSITFQNHFTEYLNGTAYTKLSPDLSAYADSMADLDSSGGIYLLLKDITESIYVNFIYDPQATDVHTTVEETLMLKRGVCQDFAHLMIAVCRSRGIPARYVSGYHFIGDLQGGNADYEQASHAWVEAYIPDMGWVGFDPTNNEMVNWRYVKIGHGRDYRDIVPVKGVYTGTAAQTLTVDVDVKVLED